MENDSISTTYEFRTNSAQSGGLEKNSRRERISGLGRCSAVRRSAHEAVLIGDVCGLASWWRTFDP
jgi:hypothetical protein